MVPAETETEAADRDRFGVLAVCAAEGAHVSDFAAAMVSSVEAAPRIELGMMVLQTIALPLGYAAEGRLHGAEGRMERETGLEPATSTLARWCSTN